MMPHSRPRLGELMLQHGLIGLVTQAQLDEALQQQRGSVKPVGEILQEMGAVTQGDLARVLTFQNRLSAAARR